MGSDIDAHFAHRISEVEANLLNPILDRASLAAFNDQWLSLVDDLQEALEADSLNISTVSMAHDLAHQVPIVMQTFVDLETLSEGLMSSLDLEASSILGLPAADRAATPSPSPIIHPRRSSTPTNFTAKNKTSFPSYIEPSYKWLLNNLHNPYPSKNTRDRIAEDTGCARKDIDGWFIDARKRIGWNDLRKTWFSNKRIDIVEAATEFFLPSQSTVNPGPERIYSPLHRSAFAEIESNAQELYSMKFSQSDLAVQLDMAVKDMTPEMKEQAKDEERRRRRLEREAQRSMAVSSYPSPERSLSPSPELAPQSPAPSQNESDHTVTFSRQSRKRRSASVEHDDPADGPNKRSRYTVPCDTKPPTLLTYFVRITLSNDLSFPSGLPSPASSVHISLTSDESDVLVPSLSVKIPTVPLVTSNRKRRLSDSDGQGPPKRPCNIPAGPRLQAVSDPMPFPSANIMASEFDGWFQKHFDHVTTSTEESESSTPLEVELYDCSTFNDENQLTSVVQYRKVFLHRASLSYLFLPSASPQTQNHNALASSTESSGVQPFELNVSTNNFNYDELFSSDDLSQEYGAHRKIVHCSTYSQDTSDIFPLAVQSDNFSDLSCAVPTALGMDFSSNYFNFNEISGQGGNNTDNAFIADPSSPISNNPATNLEWAFPPFISFLPTAITSADKFQDLLNISPQGIDSFNPLTMNLLQSLNSMPENQGSALSDRAAKQAKLLEIQETARRLEAELAVSYVF